MSLISVNPHTDPRWRHLVESRPSTVFHSPEWIHVLADTYNFEPCAHLLLDDTGVPVAGLPFCTINDMFGERIIALPFSDFCDPLIDTSEQWHALADPLLARGCPVAIRCLHEHAPLNDQRFNLVKQARWHAVDLTDAEETIWQRIHESSRRAIRKARQDGVIVRAARCEEDLHAFFDMHMRLRKYKYQLLAQPYSFFQNIWRQFIEPGQGVLLLATYQDTPIGGVMFLEWQNTLYYKFNASDPDHLGHRPNDLVIWTGIQHARERNCRRLDFGLSDWDQEGLLRYKRKFATEEQPIAYLRYQPCQEISPQERQARALLGHLTELFVDPGVPDSITTRAGDEMYRYFA